jgi:hypothetical protein
VISLLGDAEGGEIVVFSRLDAIFQVFRTSIRTITAASTLYASSLGSLFFSWLHENQIASRPLNKLLIVRQSIIEGTWHAIPDRSSAVLFEMSQLLNTQLDKETLATCVSMIESGANPEAVAVGYGFRPFLRIRTDEAHRRSFKNSDVRVQPLRPTVTKSWCDC